VGTLLSFATLGVGFLMRPIGGSVGGYLADRFGRKPVLVGALLLMGIATFAIGLLPTYAQVGILAPILLVSIRIIQGLAFGAEWGGAVMMAYEHAPWRRRGRFAAIPQAGNPLGKRACEHRIPRGSAARQRLVMAHPIPRQRGAHRRRALCAFATQRVAGVRGGEGDGQYRPQPLLHRNPPTPAPRAHPSATRLRRRSPGSPRSWP
jgi:Major Facilitator Superfamily